MSSSMEKRGAPRKFPDPDDRSVNAPSIIIGSDEVLGYYNQQTEDSKKRVVDSVKDWYAGQATEQGWSSAEFHGNQCILIANISRNT